MDRDAVNEILPEYDLNETDIDNISSIPQGESTIIPNPQTNYCQTQQSDSVDVLKNMFKDFQINIMNCINARDSVMCNELGQVESNVDEKFDRMMSLIKANNDEINLIKQSRAVRHPSPIPRNNFQEGAASLLHQTSKHHSTHQFNLPSQSVTPQNEMNVSFTPSIQNNNTQRKKLYDLPSFDWPLFFTSFNETTKAYGNKAIY